MKGDEVGYIQTIPLKVSEETLTLNLSIQIGGSVRVGMLNGTGSFISGLGLDDCLVIEQGGLETAVQWHKAHFKELKDQTIQLVFEFQKAKLFAFSGCVRE